MPVELLSHSKSILNPLVKVLIFLLFVIGTWYYYRAWKKFWGNLKRISGALMCGGIAGCVAAGFRILGDYMTQFKWMVSTGSVIFAIVSVFVAYLVYTNLTKIAAAFGITGGNK